MNEQIDSIIEKSSYKPLSKDDIKKLQGLRDFRFALFDKGSCQCADGEWLGLKGEEPLKPTPDFRETGEFVKPPKFGKLYY